MSADCGQINELLRFKIKNSLVKDVFRWRAPAALCSIKQAKKTTECPVWLMFSNSPKSKLFVPACQLSGTLLQLLPTNTVKYCRDTDEFQ